MADAESIFLARGNDAFTDKTETIELLIRVRIRIRHPGPEENPKAPGGILLVLVQVLVEVVVDRPGV